MAHRLSDRVVKSLPCPAVSNKISYDTEIKGFGFRITAANAKSFILNYRVNGRERRITIGAYPDWTVAAAREEAKHLKREVNKGLDPMGMRHADRAAPNVRDLAKRYLAEYAINKVERARQDDKAILEKLVFPELGSVKVQDVRREDIDRLHRVVSTTRPIRANRMAQLLSKLFNLAIRWELRVDNPVVGLKRNLEEKRTRYLSGDELRRLMQVLSNHSNQQSANVIRLLLLTGARRGEVLGATWNDFDLKVGVWTKPSAHTKQKKEHRVPLSAAAIQLLSEIEENAGSSRHVFPGRVPGEPLKEIRGFWSSICREAELDDFRIHDLRHTYASILASAGLSLPVIGALLGHTQPNTTARYSHLFDDPLREATERVGSLVSAAGSEAVADVVELPKIIR
jgi:integrase